jgi:hypothetical protein
MLQPDLLGDGGDLVWVAADEHEAEPRGGEAVKAMADRRCIWGFWGPREAAYNQRGKAHGGARQ